MKNDLSRLFSGVGQVKPQLEFVSSRRGPFTGQRLGIKANDRLNEGRPASLSVSEFFERQEDAKAAGK